MAGPAFVEGGGHATIRGLSPQKFVDIHGYDTYLPESIGVASVVGAIQDTRVINSTLSIGHEVYGQDTLHPSIQQDELQLSFGDLGIGQIAMNAHGDLLVNGQRATSEQIAEVNQLIRDHWQG